MRQKDFPKEITVGDNIWSVRFVRHIPHDVPGRICLGLAEPSEQIIFIKMGQKPKARLHAFLHEILHVLEYEYDLSIPHRLIYRLEDPLARFLMDNYLS